MTNIPATRDLTAIGVLCQRLQRSFRDIEAAAERAGICPALRINGVWHFDADQEQKIREQLNKPNEKRSRR